MLIIQETERESIERQNFWNEFLVVMLDICNNYCVLVIQINLFLKIGPGSRLPGLRSIG